MRWVHPVVMASSSSAGIERFSKNADSYDDRVSPTLSAVADAIRSQGWFKHWHRGSAAARAQHPVAGMSGYERPRAMELGCGTGQLAFELLADLAHCTGVDPAEGMIRVFQQKIAQQQLNTQISAVCVDLLNTTPESPPEGLVMGGYDLIFSKLAFHHIRDCAAMVKALVPYLAEGGRLLIVDLEAGGNARQFHLKEMECGVEYEHDGISESAARDWFSAAGLAQVEVARTWFEQPTHEGWREAEPGLPRMSEFSMLLISAIRPHMVSVAKI